MGISRSGAVAAAIVVLSLGAAACGSSTTATPATTTTGAPGAATPTSAAAPASTAAGGPATVAIQSFMFKPSPLTAKVGDTITITNKDSTAHTFTADDGSFDTKSIDAGASATVKLTKPGTITYHCNIHQFMKGAITVSA